MTQSFDVIVIGSYSIDLIFTGLPHLPELGAEVHSTGFDMLPGESFTSSIAMHRLGLRVGWAGDFGDDEFSRFALERARLEGLDPSLFVLHPQPLRRISVATSFPHERAFITYYDPDPNLPAAVHALSSDFVTAHVLYIPGFYYGPLLETGVKLARQRKMKVVMDGNSGTGVSMEDPLVRKAVQSVDVLLPNAREARCLTGKEDPQDALKVLAELCPLVVVKDGPRGAYAAENCQALHAPALSINPLDTTGAGDCFNAGFIKAWLDRLPLIECLRWGNVVGGLSTLGMGGTGRAVTAAEVQVLLR